MADEASALALKPRSATFAEAAALVFGGITARAFFKQARLEKGSRVLVNGASGAVGSAAVQLAKAEGAHVTAVCSATSASMVKCLGADEVVDYHTADFSASDASYDIVMDCVGNAPFSRVLPIVASGGSVLVVAGDLASVVGASRHGRKHGLTVAAAPGPYLSADLDYLVGLFDEGTLRPVIDRTYLLDQIADAHRYVDTNHKRGTVVIDVAAQRKEHT